MAVFGISMFMRYEKWGWSYNWYKTITGDDPSAWTPPLDWFTRLQACHSNYVVFERFRVVNTEQPRKVFSRPLLASFGTGGPTIAHPNYSIELLGNSEDGARRILQLRGVPAAWPAIDPETGQSEVPGDAIQILGAFMQASVDQFEIRQLRGLDVNPNREISLLGQSAAVPGFLAFTTVPDIGLVVNDRVKIGRTPGDIFPGLNQEYKVIHAAGGSYTIDYRWDLGDDAGPYNPDNGVARKAEYTQKLIKEWRVFKVSSRNTGRPSGLSRGRSSAAYTRR